MEQSPSWEGSNHSDSQKILHLLWNPNVHYHFPRSPLVNPTLNNYDKGKNKFVPVINKAPRHEDVLGEWMYNSTHS